MAVFYPIKCVERQGDMVVLEFSKATAQGNQRLGNLCVDLKTQEIELIQTFDQDAVKVFIPVRWAEERQLRAGQIPDKFSYSA